MRFCNRVMALGGIGLLGVLGGCSQSPATSASADTSLPSSPASHGVVTSSLASVDGFSNVTWRCPHRGSATLSFQLVTEGRGTGKLIVEDINPSTQPSTSTAVLDMEFDLSDDASYSITVDAGHHVHAGVKLLGDSVANQQDLPLNASDCTP